MLDHGDRCLSVCLSVCVEQDLCSDTGRSCTEHLLCGVSSRATNHSHRLWRRWDFSSILSSDWQCMCRLIAADLGVFLCTWKYDFFVL